MKIQETDIVSDGEPGVWGDVVLLRDPEALRSMPSTDEDPAIRPSLGFLDKLRLSFDRHPVVETVAFTGAGIAFAGVLAHNRH